MRPMNSVHLSAVSLSLLLAACSGSLGARYLDASRRVLVERGEWTMEVETEVLPNALVGVVYADGCLDMNAQMESLSMDSDSASTKDESPDLPPWCDRFGLADALVVVQFGPEEVQVRTDAEGRFSITDGGDLARLVTTGETGAVAAFHTGRTATARVVSAGLSDAAALATLDAMQQPTLPQLTEFMRRFGNTPAGELALSRHYDVACGELADAATAAMRSGDNRRAREVVERFDEQYEQLFCGVCHAECVALGATRELLIDTGGEP